MHVIVLRFLGFLLVTVSVLIAGCGGGGGGGSKTPPDTGDVSADSELIYQPGVPAPFATVGVAKSVASGAEEIAISLDDGTLVKVPALQGAYEARLERTSTSEVFANTLQADTGVILSGSTRRLLIRGSGDISMLVPEVIIPRAEAGSVNPETISVIRRGPAMVDGEYVDDHIMALPVRVDGDGNFRVVDPMINEWLVVFINAENEAGEPSNGSGNVMLSTRSGKAAAWELQSEYVLMSFENDLNWNRKPRLVRMIIQPDEDLSGFRRPATSQEIAEMAKKPLCNLVFLVHGHNEQEKGGASVATSEDTPWLFSYKRLVWDLFYQKISSTTGSGDQQKSVYPLDCTAFYEFVFPTYRPIFSPAGAKTGKYHETLGEALGKAISQEMSANPQLGAMLQNNMPFNVMMLAHSQGGLVARAGLRHLPETLRDRVVRLVTWGSPHQGAALYTLRYALQSGQDMVIDGWRIPLQSVASNPYLGDRYRDALNVLAIDAPGIRDIRWSKAWDHKTRVLELFPGLAVLSNAQIPVPLFSENLTVFNADTQDETISGGYTFITGQTSKSADFEFNSVTETWDFIRNLSGIQKGATLNRLMMASDYDRMSDGAVPIFSQSAGDIVFGHPVRVRDLGDMDHEEFYGSEHEQRTADTLIKGDVTANATLEEFGMLEPSRRCPTLGATRLVDGGNTRVVGAIDHGLVQDQQISFKDQVARIEIREGDQDGRVIRSGSYSISDDGTFELSLKSTDMPDQAVAVAVLKDNSEISGKVTGTEVTILPPRIITYEVASGVDEVEESFEAGATPEGVYRYEWQFPGGETATQLTSAGEVSSVSHVFRDYEFDVPVAVRVLLYDANNSLLATDSISVTFVEKEPAPLFEYDCGWEVDYASLSFATYHDGYSFYSSLDAVFYYEAGYLNSARKRHGPGVAFYDNAQRLPELAICFRDNAYHGYMTGWYDDDERTLWYEVWYEDGQRHGPEYRYFKSDNWCVRTDFSRGVASDSNGFSGQCPWRAADGGLTLTGVDPGS